MQGSGNGVYGSGVRGEGLGVRVWGLGFSVWGVGFRVQGLVVGVSGSVRPAQLECYRDTSLTMNATGCLSHKKPLQGYLAHHDRYRDTSLTHTYWLFGSKIPVSCFSSVTSSLSPVNRS